MYEWLQEELALIRTPYFHVVDGPKDLAPDLRREVESMPASYRAFVEVFGRAKLYRYSDRYKLEMAAYPERTRVGERTYLKIGRTQMGLVYFDDDQVRGGAECPVLEWNGPESGWRNTKRPFDEWLRAKCDGARKKISKQEWKKIIEGPPPFTDTERAIVQARRQYKWTVLGLTDSGEFVFRVFNGSALVLPFLTIGVRHRNGEKFGGVKLPVGDVLPGESRTISLDCYKATHDPKLVEPIEEPDPEPALRDLYWEFKNV